MGEGWTTSAVGAPRELWKILFLWNVHFCWKGSIAADVKILPAVTLPMKLSQHHILHLPWDCLICNREPLMDFSLKQSRQAVKKNIKKS